MFRSVGRDLVHWT